MNILSEVKLTTASFKEGIQIMLKSLAEATLERVDLRKTVETASWSASQAGPTVQNLFSWSQR